MTTVGGTLRVHVDSLGQFRTKILHPSVRHQAINHDITFGQQSDNVSVRKRIPQLSTNGVKYDVAGKTVLFERGSTRHAEPQKQQLHQRQNPQLGH
ncbi:hypothetical protein [Ruegeria atlantica]|uniref:hypothetical protein n=1 Tax=Ruegeria atlantica TaxID=81569 RepID=UPI001C2C33E1|nr:hypothetical protein [Ruegeria atlantica]